jgi:hypothetical protein
LVIDEKADTEDAGPDAAMKGAPTAVSCWAVHPGSISKLSAWQLQHRSAMRGSLGSLRPMIASTARRPAGLARVRNRSASAFGEFSRRGMRAIQFAFRAKLLKGAQVLGDPDRRVEVKRRQMASRQPSASALMRSKSTRPLA